jgi:hypothetical protein
MIILTITTIPFYHQMVMVKWSKLTDIQQFQQISATNWHCNDCHDQIWTDHFDHRTSILDKWSKIVVIESPPSVSSDQL